MRMRPSSAAAACVRGGLYRGRRPFFPHRIIVTSLVHASCRCGRKWSIFSGVLLALWLCAASRLVAQEDRLIDKSIEPPTQHSADWAETIVPPPSPPVAQPFGPIAPAARQPVGALSGRIIFMNGGHGWTFDPDHWRLQRGVLNEMNEDYGNIDQMNFFATYCFNAGAVIVPMRPIGQQTNEVVLDNDDAGVTYTGSWSKQHIDRLLWKRRRRAVSLRLIRGDGNRDGDLHAEYSGRRLLSRLHLGATRL